MKPKILLLILIPTILSSCVGILKVRIKENGKWKNTRGIPFYTQKQVIKQQTKYLYWWYEVTLYETSLNGNNRVEKMTEQKLVDKNASAEAFNQLLSKIQEFNSSDDKDRGKKKPGLQELPSWDKKKFSSDSQMVGEMIENSWKPEVIIDYENPIYLNGSLPWFGSGNFSQKLNAEGTLSEASGEADTQLDDFITNILPIKEFLSSILVPSESQDMNTLVSDTIQTTFLKVSIQQKGYIYNFTRIHCKCGICDDCCMNQTDCPSDQSKTNSSRFFAPIDFNLVNGNYTRTAWNPGSTPKEKRDRPTIDIAGQIQLPSQDKKK